MEPVATIEVRLGPGSDQQRTKRRFWGTRRAEILLAWATPAVLILLWQLAAAAGWIDTRFFPEPAAIASEAKSLIGDSSFRSDIWISTTRVVIGFGLGAVAGLAIGFITGMSRLGRSALEPLLSALYTVPKLALFPLLLLIFGIGETPKIMLIAITVFFFVWISTMEAVISIDPALQDAARAFRCSRWQTFRHVIFPGSLPDVLVGMRISTGVAVLMMVGAEFVQGSNGIGYFIWNSWSLFIATRMYVGMVAVALMGLLFAMIIRAAGRVLAPWAPRSARVRGRF